MSFKFPAVRRQNSDQWSDCRRTSSSGSVRAQSLGLKSFWVIHGGLSQDGIVSGSRACCLSVFLHGIAVSAKTPASLRKALAFRAVRALLEACAARARPRANRGAGCPAAQGGNRGRYAVHTTETRSRSNREADGGHPSASGHGAFPGEIAETDLDNVAEHTINDHWNVNGANSVSGELVAGHNKT